MKRVIIEKRVYLAVIFSVYFVSNNAIGYNCNHISRDDFPRDHSECLSAMNHIAMAEAGVDCIDCLTEVKDTSHPIAETLQSLWGPAFMFGSVAVTAKAHENIQEAWAESSQKSHEAWATSWQNSQDGWSTAYSESRQAWADTVTSRYQIGYDACTSQFNDYTNYLTERGANPLNSIGATNFAAQCNGTLAGPTYTNMAGMYGDSMGGIGNSYLNLGYSGDFMSGLIGPSVYNTGNYNLSHAGNSWGRNGIHGNLLYPNGAGTVNGNVNWNGPGATGNLLGNVSLNGNLGNLFGVNTNPSVSLTGNAGLPSVYGNGSLGTMASLPNMGLSPLVLGGVQAPAYNSNIALNGNVGLNPNAYLNGNVGLNPNVSLNGNVGLNSNMGLTSLYDDSRFQQGYSIGYQHGRAGASSVYNMEGLSNAYANAGLTNGNLNSSAWHNSGGWDNSNSNYSNQYAQYEKEMMIRQQMDRDRQIMNQYNSQDRQNSINALYVDHHNSANNLDRGVNGYNYGSTPYDLGNLSGNLSIQGNVNGILGV